MVEQDSVGVGLAEALEALRRDLVAAQAEAAGRGVQFPVESLTVELKVAVAREASGKVGFRVPLLGAELGGGGGVSSESVQTITLVLGEPVDEDGVPIKVASRTGAVKD
jgi:hypothetical protein